jgi:SAM-dependent methyltransferase
MVVHCPRWATLTRGRSAATLARVTEPTGAATFRTPAEAYDQHIGRYGPELARALCDAAGVAPGMTALDVGCGPGALTTVLVERLGGARVAAADPSAPFAAACAERLPGVRVEHAPAERLPFGDAEFDVALAQLVVNFMSDARAGVGEMARVTRAGGTVGAAVWDYAGEMTLLRRFWDAAVALDPSARAHDEFDDLWRPLETGVGPSGAYVAALAPANRAALREELRARLGVADGPFRLEARAWVVTGRV